MNGEARAFADCTLHFDATAVGVDNGADKAQAESKSPLRTALVAAIKPLPDARDFLRWNSFTGIFDLDDNFVAAGLRGDFNATTGRRVLNCVVQPVYEHLTQTVAIGTNNEV